MSALAEFAVVYFGLGLICAAWAVCRRKKLEAGLFVSLFCDPLFGFVGFLFWPVWLCALLMQRDGDGVPATVKEHVTETIRGEEVEVVVELRPTGRVKIGHLHFEARDEEGGIVPVGTHVVVTGKRLGELTVRKAVGGGVAKTLPHRS